MLNSAAGIRRKHLVSKLMRAGKVNAKKAEKALDVMVGGYFGKKVAFEFKKSGVLSHKRKKSRYLKRKGRLGRRR